LPTVPTDSREQRPIRIVVADDHSIVRDGIIQELRRHADLAVVGTAATGAAATGAAALEQAHQLLPDVLLLDLCMPGLQAIEVVRQVRTRLPDTRVLMLTAYGDVDQVLALLAAGATGYMLKDEEPATIAQAVRAVARGEAWLSTSIATSLGQHMAQRAGEPEPGLLSAREIEILHWLAQAKSNAEIGGLVGLSERTVRYHLGNICTKFGMSSRRELLAWAVRQGFDRLPETDS